MNYTEDRRLTIFYCQFCNCNDFHYLNHEPSVYDMTYLNNFELSSCDGPCPSSLEYRGNVLKTLIARDFFRFKTFTHISYLDLMQHSRKNSSFFVQFYEGFFWEF